MRRTPATLAATLTLIAALALAGCGSGEHSTAKGTTAPSAAAETFPVTEDGTTLAARPQRIVSLSATATDMLFSIGAGDQVVAVDQYSTYLGNPTAFGNPAPTSKPAANLDAYKPNAEAIAALNPDLVVLSNDENKITESLAALKIPVYTAPAAVTIDDTYHQETALGALTDHVTGAANVVNGEKKKLTDALSALQPRTAKLTYYYELDPTFYSVTSKTFIGSLFTMANMTNIADPADADGKSGGYPQLSAEAIIKANPNVIVLADTAENQSAATVAARPGWATLTAVKNGDVLGIDDSVASQWGTRVPDLLTQIVTEANKIPAS